MKNKKKIIIALSLIAIFIYVMVSLFVNKDGTMYWINRISAELNKPLPIIGIPFVVLLYFLYKCFVKSKYGKGAINDLRRSNEDLRQDNINFKEIQEKRVKSLENKIKEQTELISKLCSLSTNQKIKNFGKEISCYGEQTNDSETKAD